jgi:uncharacterized damage-inducible protein DinB
MIRITIALLMLSAAGVSAQDVVVANLRSLFEGYKQNALEAAEKFSEADYDFKPSPDVMSVRGVLAHLGDANFAMCSQLKGEANPSAGPIEKRETGKPALIAAVRTSFDYCLGAMAGWPDAKLAEVVRSGARARAKAWTALHLLEHTALHYGNLITYMRMKGIVPPETERRQARPPQPAKP